MRNLFIKISAITIITMVTACQTQRTFLNSKAEYEYKNGTSQTGTSQFFIGGVGQTDKIDAVKICGKEENIQAVESSLPFLYGLVGGVTLGIYAPREYTVYCK